jgi:phage-related protein
MPELKKFGAMWKPLGKAIQNLWAIAKPIWALMLRLASSVLPRLHSLCSADTIEPALKHLGKIFAGIIRVIRGVFEIIIGILSGDWSLAWQGVLDIVTGTWKAIWNLIAGFIS